MASDMKMEFVDADQHKRVNINGLYKLPQRFAAMNKLILRDLNNNPTSPTFSKYTKDDIQGFLENPYSNQKQLRDAVIYIYGASSHFRRLIQYFAGLTDLAYVVSPHKIDTATANKSTIRRNYRRVLALLAGMDIKRQFSNAIKVCLREDTFYGTMHVTSDNIIIQQLPSDYCQVAVIEDNVMNVSFDFSYFDRYSAYLPMYPPEFQTKYNAYRKNITKMRWQELDAPTSFAIKANDDIPNYSLPPFVGILREIYDIEDLKALRLTRTELENYALLVMKLGIDAEGNWEMPFEQARDFWNNLSYVLPEQVGSVLSPMEVSKISFERNSASDDDTVADAEQNMFTAAGVSSLLFNNEKASANALALSIKADQAITFGIVRSIEAVINRYIAHQSYGKYFKVTFLDVSPYNRKEASDGYLKACQYGLPMVSYYCASQGLMQDEMDCMNFLEDDVLGIKGRFIPLASSATQSATDSATDGEAGRPEMAAEELTESGERTREEA